MYRRNLPHWYPPGAAVFVTWRLAGTFPDLGGRSDDGHAFALADRMLDRAAAESVGPLWLQKPEIAKCVLTHVIAGAETDYQLHAFVVMPNHVHVLLTPWIDLSPITQAMKGRSARQANLLPGRTGNTFWQDESFDHWIRPQQFERVKLYIERNPVKAGLVERPEQWPYSSASLQK